MKVSVKKEADGFKCIIRYIFELDDDDKTSANSFNAGNNAIKLSCNHCSFYFPFDIALPHPDLCCMAALKIISPYIGSKIIMDRPVSADFANAVKAVYPNVKYVEVDNTLSPRRSSSNERIAVSFSGGADSLAVANLCEPGTPLILSARRFHPDIGRFESWYNTEANKQTLLSMSDDYVKICVESDFEFLSTNGSYCIYPDKYSFTIPSILLADYLDLNGIFVGDMLAAFTNNERNPYRLVNFQKLDKYYRSAGLRLESPVMGVTEIGTEMINRYYNNSEISTSCQYGSFKNPCYKCVKCFRKTLIKSWLSGTSIDDEILKKFESSSSVKKYIESESLSLPRTMTLLLSNFNNDKYPMIMSLKNKLHGKDVSTSMMDKLLLKPYLESDSSNTLNKCLFKLLKIFNVMSNEEAQIFKE